MVFNVCALFLQFGNESLSIKLEEQITDNENLRNKYFFVSKWKSQSEKSHMTIHLICKNINVYLFIYDILSQYLI